WYRQFDLQAPCSLEVKLATAQDVASSTQLIATEVIDSIYHNSVNTFTVGTNGIYYVAFHAFLPNTAPIQGSSSLRVDFINLSVATGINENTNPGGVSVFPNPSSGLLNLRVMKFENANIRVFDILGQEIHNSRMSDINTQIDLSNFAKGLYVVKVEGNGFNYSEKVTIQ
ncbi:MAG: T9SS type A sorting domain-containing protein, partial [Chitinophagaceae bacterium]|nr:T9SS type A sorting domain-containing protein [Chitinophagaceae bacterium]